MNVDILLIFIFISVVVVSILFVVVFASIKRKKRENERIEYEHYYKYTKLVEYSKLETIFESRIAEAKDESKVKMAFLYMDIDDFSKINDQYGEKVGNMILNIIPRRIANATREGDYIARVNEDEFLVIITDVAVYSNIDIIANRLIEHVSKTFHIDNHVIELTISVGISAFPKDANRFEDLVKCAKKAMFDVKRFGKNHYQVYQFENDKEVNV